jgi:outer membrane protein OmpA-like peptidoglycan-associated protein
MSAVTRFACSVRVGLLATLTAALLAWSASAMAQTSNNPCATTGEPNRCFDMQLFLPTPNIGTTFMIDTPSVPRHLTFVFGANFSIADGLFERVEPDVGGVPQEPTTVVNTLLHAELMAAIGLFEFFEIGLIVPIAASWHLGDPNGPDSESNQTSGAGLGDIRVLAKIPILRGDFGLALRGVFTIPTAAENSFLGTDYWTLYPNLVAAYKVWRLTFGAEFGYRFRRRNSIGDFEQDDELQGNLGASVEVVDFLDIIAESQIRIGVGGQFITANENPADFNGGVRIWPTDSLAIDIGAGTGLAAGYGAPNFRIFAAIRYATQDEPCLSGPEDFDGFEDGDFCADPDNDGDGIEDSDDDCPNDPEDMDQFRDEDGCPDLDNDADGVLDPQDECPNQSEDMDGFEDADGCPDEDNDGDGIPDGLDQCPMDPEDLDNYQDDDGCPEPGPERATVTVTDTRILISERIYFDFDRDTIRSVSMPLLDQVARAVQQLPANRRIRVEGYTDDNGEERYNTDLSYRRARAVVEYLASRGVARGRLDYVGYGVRNPVAPNDSPEGRALNRRVEFTILQPGEGR